MVIARHFGFERFLEDIRHASELGKLKKVDLKEFNNIVFLGIGGSGVPGEIVKSLDLKIPVICARETLPAFVDKNTLCFVVSYSGDTKETITLYKKAKKKKARVIVITSGGKLAKLKEEKVLIPTGYLPREGVIYLLMPILNILGVKYNEAIKVIERAEKKDIRLFAKKLAGEFKLHVPIIYVSEENLRALGERWTKDFNENAKVFAHTNFFPEVLHNEVEARFDYGYKVILLVGKINSATKKAAKILNCELIKLDGRSLIAKMLYGTYLSGLVSYYLSEELDVDYRETLRLDYLKGKRKRPY